MRLDDETMAAISGLDVTSTGGIRIGQKLERGLYLKVNKALEAIGFRWTRKAGAHMLQTESEDPHAEAIAKLDRVFATGEVTTNADLGFFETPAALGEVVARLAEIEPHHAVLEPSAGLGALYRHIIMVRHQDGPLQYNEKRGPAFVGLIERDADRRRMLKPIVRDCDEVVELDDFLDFTETEPYDRVVMNPPFCKVGRGDHIDHVRHAFTMLSPGGILVAILPAGVLFRQDKRHASFRETYGKLGEFMPLPDNSFKESDTSVRTCVLKARRK